MNSKRKGNRKMSKPQKIFEYILGSLLAVFAANYMLLGGLPGFLRALAPWLFLLLNLYPALPINRPRSYRLGVCNRGCNLLIIFAVSTLINVPIAILGMCGQLPQVVPLTQERTVTIEKLTLDAGIYYFKIESSNNWSTDTYSFVIS